LYRYGVGSVDSNTASPTIFLKTYTTFPSAGEYIRLFNANDNVVFWYKINGSGTQPSLSSVDAYVEIDLYTGMTYNVDLGYCVAAAANGNQLYYINTIAGSSLTDGAYFTFSAGGQQYCVYYAQSPSTPKPAITGAIFIRVNYTTFDSSALITTNTISAINMMYFATPDISGAFPRIYDPNGNYDKQFNLRMSNNFANPNDIGGIQFDDIYGFPTYDNDPNDVQTYNAASLGGSIAANTVLGGTHGESRPYNFYVNVLVHL